MVKKSFLVLVFCGFILGNVFAQSEFKISVGAGGYFTSDFGGGVEASVGGIKVGDLKTPYFGGGGFAFLDLTYAEINLGFFSFGGEWEDTGYGVGTYKYDVNGMGIDIGILGKYPFILNNRLTLFPMFGITYRAIISAELDNKETDDTKDLNALWFKVGGGLDYLLTENIYLRAGILYGVRLSNEFEQDLADYLEYNGATSTEKLLGHGIELKLAVGYKF